MAELCQPGTVHWWHGYGQRILTDYNSSGVADIWKMEELL